MSDDRFTPESTVYSKSNGTMMRDTPQDNWVTTTEWILSKMIKDKISDDELKAMQTAKLFFRAAYEEALKIYQEEKKNEIPRTT